MKVYLYSGMQNMIEKSGVGRAIYHQQSAARKNKIGLAKRPEDAEVIHINTVFPKSLLLAKRAKKMGIPVVYHAHSTKEDFRNSYIGSNLFAPLFGKWIQYCYNTGAIIITPTEYSKRLLISYGIKKKIEVLSNGIDLTFYNKKYVDKMSFRKKYGYTAEQKIVMSVGLTIERKGISDFVELAKRMPEYQFVWFGETNLNTVKDKESGSYRTTESAVCRVRKSGRTEGGIWKLRFIFISIKRRDGRNCSFRSTGNENTDTVKRYSGLWGLAGRE